jgi:hypothetical protein
MIPEEPHEEDRPDAGEVAEPEPESYPGEGGEAVEPKPESYGGEGGEAAEQKRSP